MEWITQRMRFWCGIGGLMRSHGVDHVWGKPQSTCHCSWYLLYFAWLLEGEKEIMWNWYIMWPQLIAPHCYMFVGNMVWYMSPAFVQSAIQSSCGPMVIKVVRSRRSFTSEAWVFWSNQLQSSKWFPAWKLGKFWYCKKLCHVLNRYILTSS
jgi:hypothetical protein